MKLAQVVEEEEGLKGWADFHCWKEFARVRRVRSFRMEDQKLIFSASMIARLQPCQVNKSWSMVLMVFLVRASVLLLTSIALALALAILLVSVAAALLLLSQRLLQLVLPFLEGFLCFAPVDSAWDVADSRHSLQLGLTLTF